MDGSSETEKSSQPPFNLWKRVFGIVKKIIHYRYYILTLSLFFIVGILASISFQMYIGKRLTGELTIRLLLSATTTVVTLMLLQLTVAEGKRDRWSMFKQSAIERRRIRLKEQLDFYLPIVTQLRAKRAGHGIYQMISVLLSETELFEIYELYAEKDLMNLIRMYIMRERPPTLTDSEFNSHIFDTILEDFERLKKEYLENSSTTGPKT